MSTPDTTTAPAVYGDTYEIPLARVFTNPTNYRRTYDPAKLQELADSMKLHGVLQPVLVRPRPGSARSRAARGRDMANEYELVIGERRRRAAELAGLETLPARIRDLNDREVLEIQIVENCQREDVPPLEEAEGLRALHEIHGYSVDEIAAKLGREAGYVYRRLRLTTLVPELRAALVAGRIGVAVAEVLARVPPEHQAEALEQLVPEYEGDPSPTVREAQRLVRQRFTLLQLSRAPFDVADAELVAGAGVCAECPSRSGAQPQLFAEVTEADSCTDPKCWGEKRDAAWAQKRAAAEAEGQRVIEGKDAEKLFPYGPSVRSTEYVDLDETVYSVRKPRALREVLGKKRDVPKVLVQGPDGEAREVARVADVRAALRAAPGKDDPTWGELAPSTKGSLTDTQKRQRQQAAIEKDAQRRTMAALVDMIEAVPVAKLPAGVWQALCHGVIAASWSDVVAEVERRRTDTTEDGAKGARHKRRDDLKEKVDAMSAPQAVALFVELVVTRVQWGPTRTKLLELLGVDPNVHLEAARAAAKEKRAAAKTKKPKGGAASAAKAAAKPATGKRAKASTKKGTRKKASAEVPF